MQPPSYTSLSHKFWNKVEVNAETDCWEWTAAKQPFGYGAWNNGTVNVRANRAAMEDRYGDLGNKKVLHHCDNPPCVNPEHLYLGTAQDNIDDMHRRGRARKALGEEASGAKLTKADVIEMRRLYREDGLNHAELGRRFNVTTPAARDAIRGRNWAHVKEGLPEGHIPPKRADHKYGRYLPPS